MLHRSPPKCYHLVSAARNLKCREVLSAWWPFPLSSVKHSSFLTIFWLPGIRVILKPPFLQMEKCYPGSKLPPGLSNCKLQLDGSMPVLLTGFEPHPFDFFQLLVSSSVKSKECRYAHKSGSDAWPRVLLCYRLLTCADVAPSSSEFSTASSVLSLLINALATEST